jgi:hypothetical protein
MLFEVYEHTQHHNKDDPHHATVEVHLLLVRHLFKCTHSMQQNCYLSRFMVLTLKLPIGPVHIKFSSIGHSYWNSESDIHFYPAKVRSGRATST